MFNVLPTSSAEELSPAPITLPTSFTFSLYVFASFDAQPQAPWTDTDRAVSARVQTYWTNFARTGNANGTGAPP